MDVKTAFLYRLIEGAVYAQQQTDFDNQSGSVCKLRQALYGLKQSPQVWHDTLVAFVKSHRLKALNADLSVFVKPGLIFAVYMDDLQITGSSLVEIHAIKQALSEQFHMSDRGPCQYYLGITVTRDCKNRILRLGQRAHLVKILRDHKMTDCKAAPTPMETQHLEEFSTDYQSTTEFCLEYQTAVSSLIYVMLGTCSDLAYAVPVVSRYVSRPNNSH